MAVIQFLHKAVSEWYDDVRKFAVSLHIRAPTSKQGTYMESGSKRVRLSVTSLVSGITSHGIRINKFWGVKGWHCTIFVG